MAAKFKPCSIEGCNRPAWARGWCTRHYHRWHMHGDPLGGNPSTTASDQLLAFFEAALVHHSNDCLLWPYGQNGVGYAIMKGRAVHRLVCDRVHGPPPFHKSEVAHSCGVRKCINHRHLRWDTRAGNLADRLLHGTDSRGQKSWNAKLTEADVLQIRQLRSYLSSDEIAAMFGVARATINGIFSGRVWGWLPYRRCGGRGASVRRNSQS